MRDKPLTPAQERACQEYVTNGGNQSEAYRVAYPKSRKWKPDAVHVNASQLFADARVRLRVAELQRPAARRAELTASRLIEEAAHIAFQDPRALLDANGNYLPIHEWPAELAAAVSQIDFAVGDDGQRYVSKVRFWDKNSAHERLFKQKGLFELDNAQRSGAGLSGLPAGEREAILERLNAARSSRVGGQPEPTGPGRTTH